jgi:hypothetical protein
LRACFENAFEPERGVNARLRRAPGIFNTRSEIAEFKFTGSSRGNLGTPVTKHAEKFQLVRLKGRRLRNPVCIGRILNRF